MAEPQELNPLSDEQVEQQRSALQEKRAALLLAVKSAEQNQDPDELRVADEMDLSSAGYDQAFEYRLRDRDATLLKKIDKALRRIESGDYNYCEECENPIGAARFLARPEANMCIDCSRRVTRKTC